MKRFLCLLFALAASPAFAQLYAIRAGHIIDPASGKVAQAQTILVENGLIKAIGSNVTIPAGAQVIDLSERWVLPGLIDAHTHLSLEENLGDTQPLEATWLRETTALRALRGMHNALDVLNAGFTTIRDVGNSADYAMQDVRRAIEKNLFAGPTIIDSGKIIGPFGGQTHNMPVELGTIWRSEYVDADGPDAVRQAVRKNIYYGAGVIKLVLDNSPYYYSLEEVKAAVDEAHRAGLPVAVHVYGGAAADNAIEAGVDSVEHGFDLTEAQMKAMKAKGIFLSGGDFPQSHLEMIGTAGGLIPEPSVLAPAIIDRLARAHRAGVRLVFSTDAIANMPGRTRADMMLDYLQVWRAAGISPADILKAMTTEPAQLLRVDKKRGQLAAGLAADLIAVPSNPIADIESLRRVDFVMKDGRIVRNGKPIAPGL